MTRDELRHILDEFPRIRVLVVGDFCLDRWCTYDPDLAAASRETGIPRLAVTHYEVTPGAGGTVTNNLIALGAGGVDIVGVIGDDAGGFELERALRERGVGTRYLIRAPGRQTFTYTKVVNSKTGREDQPRVDFVNIAPPARHVEQTMIAAIEELTPSADVVIVADQSEIPSGAVISDAVRHALLRAAARFPAKFFIADSRAQIEKFRGFIVKPNEDEALEAARRICPQEPNLTVETAGEALRRHLGATQPVYVTRGPQGALLFAGDEPRLILALRNDSPVDICGAGDAFEAGLALTLAATQRLYGSAEYAAAAGVGHRVAAVTITKKGTGTATREEVLAIDRGASCSMPSL